MAEPERYLDMMRIFLAWEKLRLVYILAVIGILVATAMHYTGHLPSSSETLAILILTGIPYLLGFITEYAIIRMEVATHPRLLLFVLGTLSAGLLIYGSYESLHY